MSDPDTDAMAQLDAWCDRLCTELGIDRDIVDRDAILGLAGVVARAVVRPAAPMTTFLVGYAAGRSAAVDQPAAIADATSRAILLARSGDDDNDDTA